MWKKFVQDYLTFSKKERFAVLLLIGIFMVITILPHILPTSRERPSIEEHKQLLQEFKQLTDLSSESDGKHVQSEEKGLASGTSLSSEMFYFDPNFISVEQWIQFGVGKKTAESIRKYLSKGGKFRTPEDILRIYTLDKSLAKKLIPYIRIPEKEESHRLFSNTSTHYKDAGNPGEAFHAKEYRELDINASDTTDFKTFPGIGRKLSNRIIQYREALGGFVSIDQIGEVRFLPDTTFQKIRPFLKLNPIEIRKININTADEEELKRHPYFNFATARAIINYRQQHGPFNDISDIQSIHLISEERFKKVNSYLTVK